MIMPYSIYDLSINKIQRANALEGRFISGFLSDRPEAEIVITFLFGKLNKGIKSQNIIAGKGTENSGIPVNCLCETRL